MQNQDAESLVFAVAENHLTMNTPFVRNLKLILMAVDFMLINLAFLVMAGWHSPHLWKATQPLPLFAILNLAWLSASMVCTLYDEKHILSAASRLNCSRKAWIVFFLLFSLVSFYFFRVIFTAPVVLAGMLLIQVVLLAGRIVSSFVFNFYRSRHFHANKILIIGYNALSVQLALQLEADSINKKIIGYCEEEADVHELSRYPILGNRQQVMEVCEQYGITEIYATVTPDNSVYIKALSRLAEQQCIRFKMVPDMGVYFSRHTEIQYLQEIPVISLQKDPLQHVNNRVIKRAFDIVFSLFVLLLVNSWLIPLVAVLIWMESRGKIMFLQKRSGENNIPFHIRKFRSMYVNDSSDHIQAERDDKRITRVGRLLRSTSLDEFPQFFNVLKGDMSIVGPRPHMLKHTDEYSQLIDKYMVRQFIKPGITGWAQVNGHRGETKNIRQMQKRIECDIWYVENWSLKTDISIICKTVYNVLKGEENAC